MTARQGGGAAAGTLQVRGQCGARAARARGAPAEQRASTARGRAEPYPVAPVTTFMSSTYVGCFSEVGTWMHVMHSRSAQYLHGRLLHCFTLVNIFYKCCLCGVICWLSFLLGDNAAKIQRARSLVVPGVVFCG